MKIVVTATGPEMEAEVDPRFGRGAFYILVDTANMDHVVLPNEEGRQSPQGAGVQAAQKVAAAGAEALLTGHCGPKAHQLLEAAGIQVYNNATGTVVDAVESFMAGKLEVATGPNVEGHWQ